MDKEASLAEDLVMHMTFFSSLIIPALLTLFGLACVFSKRDVPSAFLEGAADGVRSGIGLLPSLVRLSNRLQLDTSDHLRWPTTPFVRRQMVWALPRSLAATERISFDFLSSGYLDVSVHRVPHIHL